MPQPLEPTHTFPQAVPMAQMLPTGQSESEEHRRRPLQLVDTVAAQNPTPSVFAAQRHEPFTPQVSELFRPAQAPQEQAPWTQPPEEHYIVQIPVS